MIFSMCYFSAVHLYDFHIFIIINNLHCKPSFIHTQIEIEATVVGWRGDIAIDDLQFTPGQCNKANATAVIVYPTIPPLSPPPYSK